MPLTEILTPVLVLTTSVAVLAAMIQLATRVLAKSDPGNDLEQAVYQMLPLTQCAQCGYAGCRPYAQAVIAGEATNLCLPGGNSTAQAIATLLDREPSPPERTMSLDARAYIDEAQCVGCALCLDECPVDAIVGAREYTHTVLQSHCTGCELCLPVCPVDCIEIREPVANV